MEWSRNRTLIFVALFAALLVGYYFFWPGRDHGDAAQSKSIAVFSYVTHPVLDLVRTTLEKDLEAYAAEHRVDLEFARFNAEGSDAQIAALSNTILNGRYDLIIPIATPVSRQLIQDAPKNTPIVYSFVTNPEDLGPERLTKNVTGVSDVVNYPANIQLLFNWLPEARRVGMLYNPAEPNSVDAVNRSRPLIEEQGGRLIVAEVGSGAAVAASATNLIGAIDVFYVGGDNTVVGAVDSLVNVGKQFRVPVFASDSGSVQEGAVAAVSVRYEAIGSATAEIAWQVIAEQQSPKNIPPVSVRGNELLYNPASLEEFNIEIPPAYVSDARPVKGLGE